MANVESWRRAVTSGLSRESESRACNSRKRILRHHLLNITHKMERTCAANDDTEGRVLLTAFHEYEGKQKESTISSNGSLA